MTSISTRQELTARIEMLAEAVAYCQAEGSEHVSQDRLLATYQGQLDALVGDGNVTRYDDEVTQVPRSLTARPVGGSAASNQYGTFAVHYSSAKQTAFISSLLDRKDLSSLADSVILDVARLRQQVAALEVNKRAASSIIDRLLALPDRAVAAFTPATAKATDRQISFITRLAAERELDAVEKVALVLALPTLSTKGASKTIENLLERPMAAVVAFTLEAGVYVNADGSTFRAYLGQQSGRMLAARVVDGEFEYAGQADRFVTAASRKMTAEEAGAWGKTTGRCVFCARRLDVPTSVDRGIGPDCFAKFC